VVKAQAADRATLDQVVFPPGIYSCPVDWGVLYHLSFYFGDAASLAATVNPNGCNVLTIPGTCARRVDGAYFARLAQDLGIAESAIYPYLPP
jgi:hypothetical protein